MYIVLQRYVKGTSTVLRRYLNGTTMVPERDFKGTSKVPQRYLKGTKRYFNGTTEVVPLPVPVLWLTFFDAYCISQCYVRGSG